ASDLRDGFRSRRGRKWGTRAEVVRGEASQRATQGLAQSLLLEFAPRGRSYGAGIYRYRVGGPTAWAPRCLCAAASSHGAFIGLAGGQAVDWSAHSFRESASDAMALLAALSSPLLPNLGFNLRPLPVAQPAQPLRVART